ncbi:LADA_0D04214g1_1 [Lachancea dasiensis]|uniref:BRO domain-containing protein 1 n=1 Tax=Lachancea dasiensis TaxID=1072105 RepID=A0A1G4J5A7_9SACH|nr:LADA_0D04214g1_1 [Lachancea dasiensis]
MKTLLLGFKIKDTESLNWGKALALYLKKSYGSSTWSQFFDAKLAENLDHLRSNANGNLAPEALVEQLFLYYSFLEQLHLRLGGNSGQLNLDFTWYDAAYTTASGSQKYTQRTVAFEKSSILYNLGTTLTQLAKEKVDSDVKKSIGYLSRAFTCFQYLSENFLNSPSVDLQAENTKFLADLCHAEAQELFLLQIVNGPEVAKHASLIAKLAFMASSLYQKILDFYDTEADIAKTEVPYGESKWKSIITCKLHYYKSVSAFNYGMALEQQQKFGNAIAFLQIAQESITAALSHKLHVKDVIDLESLKSLIAAKHKALIKDNDFIYHESIPSDVSMELIKSMDAIKPQTLTQLLKTYMEKVAEPADIMFKGIIPVEVYEKESIYSEQKSDLLRRELEVADTADWEYTSFVEFTTLPKILMDLNDRYTSSRGSRRLENPQLTMMKDQIDAWSKFVLQSKYNDVERQIKVVVDLRKQILESLSSIPAEQTENAVKLKSSLVAASKSDEKLFSFVESHLQEIQLLRAPELLNQQWKELTASEHEEPNLLDMDDDKNEEIRLKIKSVSNQHEDLKVLKDERSRVVQDLKKSVNEDDITRVILLNSGATDTELKEIFERELDKFKPLSTRIEATIFKQRSLINSIKISLDAIFKLTGVDEESSNSDSNLAKRNNFYDKLNKAFTNFSVFVNDLPKGLLFYESLLKMSSDLRSFGSVPQRGVAPDPAPSLPGQFSREFQQLSVSSEAPNFGQSTAPGGPPVPPRTYGEQQGYNQSGPSLPVIPPKEPPSGMTGLMVSQSHSYQTPEQNPTSFYNNPSVFDESLYSRYSG